MSVSLHLKLILQMYMHLHTCIYAYILIDILCTYTVFHTHFVGLEPIKTDLHGVNDSVNHLMMLSTQLNEKLVQLGEALVNLTAYCDGNISCTNTIPIEGLDISLQFPQVGCALF